VTFECEEELPWTVDGEFGGVHSKVVVENLQKQIEIMVPEEHIVELTEHEDVEE
jgi:diacylglycerol kinase family enzyme